MKMSERNLLRSKAEYHLSLNKIQLIKNNDYFEWLNNFTLEHSFFTNETFGKNLYDDEDFKNCPIDKNDYYKVSRLYVLYSLLGEYAIEITNRVVVFGALKKGYYFSCNGAKYYIQIEINKGSALYSCSRLPDNYLETFIDIEDIRNIYNKNQAQIKEQLALEKFRNEIRTLITDNIPEDKILEIVNEEINTKVKKIGTK